MTDITNKSDDKEELVEEEPPEKVFKRRWFILLVLVCSNVLIGFNSVCFGQMNTQYSLYYNVSAKTVDWLTLGNAVGETITCFVIAVFTLWKVIHFRWWCILLTLAASICYSLILSSIWIGEHIIIAIIGQMFMGFSGGVLESLMPLATALWFPEHQLATALGAIWVGETIGFIFGSMVPGKVITVDNYEQLLVGNITQTKSSLVILFSTMFGISLALLGTAIFLVEDKPPLPPSKAAAKRFFHPQAIVKCNCATIKHNAVDFLQFLKEVFSNYTSVGLTICFAIAYTLTTLQFMFTSDLVQTDKHKTAATDMTESSDIMLALCIGCLIGGLFGGWLLDKLKKYKLLMILSSCGTLLTAIPVIWGEVANVDVVIYIGNLLHGFFIMALMTIVNDSSLQHMFPAEEMAVGTWLIFVGNVMTSIVPLGARALLDSFGYVGFFSYYSSYVLMCVIFACSVKIRHIRLDINDSVTEKGKLVSDTTNDKILYNTD